MATQQEIKASIDTGLAWLVTQQSGNGSWAPNEYPVSNTGLALLKLETYALENGFETPFDARYIYKNNVVAGLNYIFSQAILDINGNGIYFKDGGSYVNYATGIVLAAICASSDPAHIVTGGAANGNTYKQVADLIVQYLAYSQENSGGWAYAKGVGTPDNSNSGYPVLGLEFAKSPAYKFECVIPQTLKNKLSLWIDYIQNDISGGSGYQISTQYVNILKTGSLIQQMHLVGDGGNSTRLQNAITYIANHWTDTIKWLQNSGDGGWINKNGQTPTKVDYQATFTTMKGLEGYGIDIIGTNIDWFAEMADAIVFLQNPADGYWPSNPDLEETVLLCTEWALLTLEKAAPSPAQIPYKNNIVVDPYTAKCPWDLEQTIDIQGEIKIFAKKYKHSEAECSSNPKASKGDDIGFTFVFGNYGEFDYTAQKNQPTIEDELSIQKPVNLKLMSLCLGDGYKVFYGNTDTEVKVCDKFYGQIGTYNLQVRKLVNGEYIADFDLPCHYICSISILFQIEFPSCPHCPDDNPPPQ